MRLRGVCVRRWCVHTGAARSRCVCVCCGACGPFAGVGKLARLGPSAEDGRCRTPTLRVDTFPPQEGSTCTSTPPASLPLTFRCEGLLRISGLHCSARSV